MVYVTHTRMDRAVSKHVTTLFREIGAIRIQSYTGLGFIIHLSLPIQKLDMPTAPHFDASASRGTRY